ncbi:MAG: hypothetical protein ACOY3I_09235 [Verrucomicrobiota bacterium]
MSGMARKVTDKAGQVLDKLQQLGGVASETTQGVQQNPVHGNPAYNKMVAPIMGHATSLDGPDALGLFAGGMGMVGLGRKLLKSKIGKILLTAGAVYGGKKIIDSFKDQLKKDGATDEEIKDLGLDEIAKEKEMAAENSGNEPEKTQTQTAKEVAHEPEKPMVASRDVQQPTNVANVEKDREDRRSNLHGEDTTRTQTKGNEVARTQTETLAQAQTLDNTKDVKKDIAKDEKTPEKERKVVAFPPRSGSRHSEMSDVAMAEEIGKKPPEQFAKAA